MTTPETQPTATQLIQAIEEHRKKLEERRYVLALQLAEVDAELALLDGVKLPKARATRKDKGATRSKPNGALDAQGDPAPRIEKGLPR